MSSQQFQESLGYLGQEEVIHRANICLMVEGADGEGAASESAGGWGAWVMCQACKP